MKYFLLITSSRRQWCEIRDGEGHCWWKVGMARVKGVKLGWGWKWGVSLRLILLSSSFSLMQKEVKMMTFDWRDVLKNVMMGERQWWREKEDDDVENVVCSSLLASPWPLKKNLVVLKFLTLFNNKSCAIARIRWHQLVLEKIFVKLQKYINNRVGEVIRYTPHNEDALRTMKMHSGTISGASRTCWRPGWRHEFLSK